MIIQKTIKNIIIYILITMVPSITFSHFFAQKQFLEAENYYQDKAQWYANFHASNIENLIGETVGRLEMLATVINLQHDDIKSIEQILVDTHKKDPRFSGFYLANPEGDIIYSSNPLPSPVNLSDRHYFQQALKNKRTSISEAHIGRVTGRYIITIASPLGDDIGVKGILLASLRLDELEEAIQDVLTDEIVIVSDDTEQTLIQTSSTVPDGYFIKSNSSIAHVPWVTTAIVIPEDEHLYQHPFFRNLVIIFTITNILYVLLVNWLLKRRLRKEKEQNEIQKLELVGNLAASTAHEIRNPLTGIKGLVKLLSEENKDKKDQFYFEVIQQEIDRINAIVSELLVLGKPTAIKLNTYNANEIVKEIEPILLSESNYMNVELKIHYTLEEPRVSCVKDHIKQVILNLAKNSLNAMPTGGKLSISILKHPGYCTFIVEDSGIGIPKEVLDQVFNPFFTMTKTGSGLGLTVCKRIIDSYGGDISIQSTPQKGTKVEVAIPLALDDD